MKSHPLDAPLEDDLELELALWLTHTKPDDPYVLKVLTEHYAGDIIRFFLALLDEGEKQTDKFNAAAALAQGVLYKAVGYPQNFKGQESVRNWLFQLAVKEFNSLRNNRGHLEKNDIFNKRKNNLFQYSVEKISLTEEDEKIVSALHGLSQEERIPIILHYIFQTLTANISQILAVRIPTVHEKITDFREVVTRKLEGKKLHIQIDDSGHTKFEPWIQLSIDGILEYDPISGAKLNLHLDTCQRCRSFRDRQLKLEKRITAALLKRWPEIRLSKTDVVQLVESYQTPPKKSFPFFAKISITQESFLLGLLLFAVIIAGYYISRRETYHANPMVYPTLTLIPTTQDRSTPPAILKEANLEALGSTPTTISGSGSTAVLLSDYSANGTNERRFIYYREPTITAGGRFVIFSASFTTITNQGPDFKNVLYLLDQQTGEIVILNQEEVEYPSDVWDFVPSVSDDENTIVFQDVIDQTNANNSASCNWQTNSIP